MADVDSTLLLPVINHDCSTRHMSLTVACARKPIVEYGWNIAWLGYRLLPCCLVFLDALSGPSSHARLVI